MVVWEQYPDLKANQNMMQLTEELTSTENKISFARQAYNDSVMTYNTHARCFPATSSPACSTSPPPMFVVDSPNRRKRPRFRFH